MTGNTTTEIKEQEVFNKVLAEVELIGVTSKENYDELNKNHKALKEELDKKIVDQTKVEKLTEDILTRQDEIDKKQAELTKENELKQKRIDELELLLKRMKPSTNTQDEQECVKEIKQHVLNLLGNAGYKSKETPTVETYQGYVKAFNNFFRHGKDDLTDEQRKALSVGVDPHGGYTVTPTMSNQITKRLFEADPIRQLVSIENITSDAWEELVDWDEFGYGWENETESGAQTATGDIYKKRIPVNIMYAKPRATQQLLEDSGFNIENWISQKVTDRFMRAEGAAFVTGDGVGKPRGFLTYTNGTAWNQVEQVNMGAAAALTPSGFIDVKYSLIEQYLSRGTWLMNRTTVAAAMKLKNGAGDFIWKPSWAKDMPETILGLPVRMSTTMPAVAANALSVVVADWKAAYKIIDRLGISVQRDPFTQKPFVEFYTRRRVGGDVINMQAIKIGKISA